MLEELYVEADGSVTEENARQFSEDFEDALEDTPDIVLEVLDRKLKQLREHRQDRGNEGKLHPILSFAHHKVGEGRQGIRIEVRCPETSERLALPYGPQNENVARCDCGELITLAGCLPIQDTELSAYEIDVAERNEEKRQAVSEVLGVDPDQVGTRFGGGGP